MLGKLLDTLRRLSKPKESQTDYDGYLSYAKEWHAALIGLGAGIATSLLMNPVPAAAIITCALGIHGGKFLSEAVKEQVGSEPWYAIGGAILTSLPYLLSLV